jgi:hypothetical protein
VRRFDSPLCVNILFGPTSRRYFRISKMARGRKRTLLEQFKHSEALSKADGRRRDAEIRGLQDDARGLQDHARGLQAQGDRDRAQIVNLTNAIRSEFKLKQSCKILYLRATSACFRLSQVHQYCRWSRSRSRSRSTSTSSSTSSSRWSRSRSSKRGRRQQRHRTTRP